MEKMNTIDAYGEFEVPEKKTRIEVVEDPVRTVMSCYEMFRNICEKNKFMDIFELYHAAEETLKGKEDLKFDTEQSKKLLNLCWSGYDDGLFLSAVQNNTELNNLIVLNERYTNVRDLGYCLKSNKLLILGSKVYQPLVSVAKCAEGTVINYGNIYSFTDHAKSGLQINFGKAGRMAYDARGGIQINIKRYLAVFGPKPVSNEEKIVIENKEINLFDEDHFFSSLEISALYKKYLFPIKQKLYAKLKELDFIPQMENDYEGLVQKVDSFDWKKFEKDIKDIADEMIRVLY